MMMWSYSNIISGLKGVGGEVRIMADRVLRLRRYLTRFLIGTQKVEWVASFYV